MALGPNLDDPGLERLRRVAARALSAPVVFLSVVDDEQQCFPTHQGLPPDVGARGSTPLDQSMCRFVVSSGLPLVVDDTAADEQFVRHPARTELGIGSYLGVPVRDFRGNVLGSFCVADSGPRNWSADDEAVLSDIAASVEEHLELLRLSRVSNTRRMSEALTHDFEEALSELATATNRAETLQGVANQLVSKARQAVGASTISLAIRRGDVLEFTHGPGLPSNVALDWEVAPLDAGVPMAEALRELRVVHLADEEEFEPYPLFAAAAEQIGLGSFRAIPFSDPTTDLEGVIGVGWAEPLSSDELPHTLGQVVSLTVQCLHRGWLFDIEKAHARLLELLVLPSELPSSVAYDIAGTYVAPNSNQRVGGDLYDVVVRDDGAVGVLVADAVGHDLVATRAASRLRHAVGVLTLSGSSPAEIMSAVNRYVFASPARRLVTCVYLLFDAEGSMVTIANAGHPPPLLVDDEQGVREVGPVGQPLLGLHDHQEYREVPVSLSDSAMLIAYTDGLVDSRLDAMLDPEDWLAGYLTKSRHRSSESIAAELEHTVKQWDSEDDIAFVFVRPSIQDPVNRLDDLSTTWNARTCRLSDIRKAIRSWAGDYIAATTIDDIVMAAGELVTNAREALARADAFREGTDTDIEVDIRPRGAVVILEVTSSGGPFDHIRAMPSPESERGRGLAIVGRLADSVALDSADGRVTVSARFSSGENLTT